MQRVAPKEHREGGRDRYAVALGSIYLDIVEVDLATGLALLDQSKLLGHLEEKSVLPWEELLEEYCKECFRGQDGPVLRRRFGSEGLRRMLEGGRKNKDMVFLRQAEGSSVNCVKVAALAEGEGRVLVTLQDVSEQWMLQSIVERYVYQNCDCFILLDATRDRYRMLSGNGSLLPPASGEYTRELEGYFRSYAAPEDREESLLEMQIPRILEGLSQGEEHSFFTGIQDPEKGYARKRFQYIFFDEENRVLLLTATDVTQVYLEEKARNDRLRSALEEARTDALTGLYNQRAVRDLVSRSLARRREGKAALLFVDLDNFKQVNDTLGHHQGDHLLQSIARAMQSSVRPGDLVSRVGGDEFVVYFDEIATQEQAAQCARRICESLGKISLTGMREPLSSSVGIAMAPQDGADYDTLRDRADEAMYAAKRKGKDRFVFYCSL